MRGLPCHAYTLYRQVALESIRFIFTHLSTQTNRWGYGPKQFKSLVIIWTLDFKVKCKWLIWWSNFVHNSRKLTVVRNHRHRCEHRPVLCMLQWLWMVNGVDYLCWLIWRVESSPSPISDWAINHSKTSSWVAEEIERIAPSSVSIISVGWQLKFLAASEQQTKRAEVALHISTARCQQSQRVKLH